MAKYIAFLRGINVGKIRIKMVDLQSAFEQMGCKSVKTYLQSGNVVFEADKPMSDLKAMLEKGLTDTFHYEAFVQVYGFGTLAAAIAGYPMTRDDSHHAYLVFIDKAPVFEELQALAQDMGEESKSIAPGDSLLYWKVPIGQSLDTPFAKLLAKPKYKSSTTVRNLNTLEKMV